MILYEFELSAFPFLQKRLLEFYKDLIEPVDCFGSFAILTIFSILVHEHGMSFLY